MVNTNKSMSNCKKQQHRKLSNPHTHTRYSRIQILVITIIMDNIIQIHTNINNINKIIIIVTIKIWKHRHSITVVVHTSIIILI